MESMRIQSSGSASGSAFGLALGLGRVLSPAGALPQAAERLDPDPGRREPDEIHIEVETLNVDSASFRQIEEASGGDPQIVAERIVAITRERGKLLNPVTGSGGMLLGRVSFIGEHAAAPTGAAGRAGVRVGDRVATLVSLTLTPLTITRVRGVKMATHQVDIDGNAIVFSSGILARMPDDFPEPLALALFDVAGAGPQVGRLSTPGGTVFILGVGGKSGLLAATAARRRVGPSGVVVGVEANVSAAAAARALGAAIGFDVVEASALDPVGCAQAALAAGGPAVAAAGGFDLTVSCVNMPGAELAAILGTRDRGKVYFFSMATSFARAALGAEGVARDVDMLIGNGYCARHAEETLDMVRGEPALRAELGRRYL
jgi:L-erythro-3,5-diaminohexanoate dehydrogenase